MSCILNMMHTKIPVASSTVGHTWRTDYSLRFLAIAALLLDFSSGDFLSANTHTAVPVFAEILPRNTIKKVQFMQTRILI